MRLLQPAFAAGEVAPSLGGRVDLAKYRIGLKTCRNFLIHKHGGASNRGGTQYLNNTKSNLQARLIPFEFSITQNYVLEFTHLKMRVFKDGAIVESSPGVPLEVTSPYTLAQILEARYTQSADVLYLAHPSVAPQDLTRTSHTAWTFSVHGTVGPVITSGMASPTAVYTAPRRNLKVTAITAASPAEVTTDGAHGFLDGQTVTFSGIIAAPPHMGTILNGFIFSIRNLAVPDPTKFEIYTTGGAAVDTTGKNFGGAGAAVTTPFAQAYYKIIGVNDLGEESSNGIATTNVNVDSPWTAGAQVLLTWTAAVGGGITGYNVYKSDQINGNFGFIGYVTGTAFTDNYIKPDLTAGPQVSKTPFSGSGNYPGAVGIFQQRLMYGRTDNNPQTFVASRTGLFSNFSISDPLTDSDAVTAAIASRQVNEIKHIVPMKQLLIMTSSTEWLCGAANNNGAITPTSISLDVQGTRGVSDVAPIAIGNTMLFVQRGGQVVRDLRYQLTDDSYTGDDLSVMAPHLLTGHNIVAWAYQANPDSVIWCVRDDGILLGLTYLREQDIWAWHRHDTDGLFESICALPGDDGKPDEIYFVVKRFIGGAWVRFVEMLRDRMPDDDLEQAYFVDAGLSYDVPLTITGFSTSGTNLVTVSPPRTANFPVTTASLPFTFAVPATANLRVYLVNTSTSAETLLTLGVGYTATLINSGANGGTVALDGTLYPTGIPAGYTGYVTCIHGMSTGDKVRITGLVGAKVVDPLISFDDPDNPINGTWFEVLNVGTYTFRIRSIKGPDTVPPTTYPLVDASLYVAYRSGGFARKGVLTVSGLGHLASTEVVALADGTVFKGAVSSGGVLTLPRRFATIHVGLPFVSDLETLELESPDMQIAGKKRQTAMVNMRLLNTGGILVGPDEDHLLEAKFRNTEGYLEATRLFTGDKRMPVDASWKRSARVMIRQEYPLPVTVLDLIPEVDIEE